jgi:SAM-dependent methyltransferase
MIPLACPACKGPLAAGDDNVSCSACARSWPVVRGVARFANEEDFYKNEGRWAAPDMTSGGIRNLLVRKQRFFVKRLRGRTGTLLDLGCGGGWRVFAQGRSVAGLDISQRSLEAARSLYGTVAAAHWTALPFAENTFDTIVSSDVLGHVEFPDKPAVFAELYRVLKPGGRTLHYIEAEGVDPVTRFNKRHPELYKRHFIDPEGHVGMEKPTAIFDRFRRAGFRPVSERGAYKVLVYVNRAIQLYDNDYRRVSRLRNAWAGGARLLMKSKPGETVGNLAVAAALELGDRLLPTDWASGVIVEYTK